MVSIAMFLGNYVASWTALAANAELAPGKQGRHRSDAGAEAQ